MGAFHWDAIVEGFRVTLAGNVDIHPLLTLHWFEVGRDNRFRRRRNVHRGEHLRKLFFRDVCLRFRMKHAESFVDILLDEGDLSELRCTHGRLYWTLSETAKPTRRRG